MHIIIDIRTKHLEDMLTTRYAVNWAKKWRKYHSSDECTFLILDDQLAPEWEKFLRVKASSWFLPNKKISLKNHKNEILRCVNFSKYSPYDAEIPTVSMIMDMGRWFYDNETNANILRRKEREYEIKKLLKNSSHSIVPSFFTGNELVELWNVHESDVDILPFVSFDDNISPNENIFQTHNLPENFFLFDATFWPESNLEILLREFAKYIQKKWKTHLLLHGNSHKNLKYLTEIIRREKLEKWVHITGCLDVASHEMLYKKAKAWVYVGAYNTTKTAVELAHSHAIPLVLSDIRAFDFYTNAIKIHPNHLENLHKIFIKIDSGEDLDLPEAKIFDEKLVFEQFKKILSKNPKISKN